MRSALQASLVFAAFVVSGCSSFGSDTGSGGSVDGGAADSGTTDAGAGVESFEAPINDTCAPWRAGNNATATLVKDGGRSGNACRVCAQAGNGAFFHLGLPAVSVTSPTTYYLAAWVKNDASLDPGAVVGATFDVSGQFNELGFSKLGDWNPVSMQVDATPGQKVTAQISGRTSAGATTACFVVDDISLTTQAR